MQYIGWALAIILGLVILYWVVRLVIFLVTIVLAAIYAFLVSLAYLLSASLDAVFGAPLMPNRPYIPWIITGAVLGALFGFLSLAPVFGLREKRSTIKKCIFGALGVLAITSIAFGPKTSPPSAGQVVPSAFPMTGTWAGQFGSAHEAATLKVEGVTGRTFTGTMQVGNIKLAVTGMTSPDAGNKLLIHEKSVLSAGKSWKMRDEQGYASVDGQTLRGGGGEGAHVYTWLFKKTAN